MYTRSNVSHRKYSFHNLRDILRVVYKNGKSLSFPSSNGKQRCRCNKFYTPSYLRSSHAHECKACLMAVGLIYDVREKKKPHRYKPSSVPHNGPDTALLLGNGKEIFEPPELKCVGLGLHTKTGMIICNKCHYAVEPKSLVAHFTQNDCSSHASKAKIGGVVKYLESGRIFYMSDNDIKGWLQTLASSAHDPFPGIRVIENGLWCNACSFSCANKGVMSGHWYRLHNQNSSSARFTHNAVQRLYTAKHLGGFIRIELPNLSSSSSEVSSPIDVEEIEFEKKQQLQRRDSGCNLSDEETEWIKYIGFGVVFEEPQFSDMAMLTYGVGIKKHWERVLCELVENAYRLFMEKQPGILISKFRIPSSMAIEESGLEQHVEIGYTFIHTILTASQSYDHSVAYVLTLKQYEAAKLLYLYLNKRVKICAREEYMSEIQRLFWILCTELWIMPRSYGDGHWSYYSVFRFLCYSSWDVDQQSFKKPEDVMSTIQSLVFWARLSVCISFQEDSKDTMYPVLSTIVPYELWYDARDEHIEAFQDYIEEAGCTPYGAIHDVAGRLLEEIQ